jgi:hypothetical protein
MTPFIAYGSLAQDETAGVVADVPAHSILRRTHVRLILTTALVVASASFVRSPDRTNMHMLVASDAGAIVLRNEYTGAAAGGPAAGVGYPFLANKLLVEPHRMTTLDLAPSSSARSAVVRAWALAQVSNCGGACARHAYAELVPQHTFTTLGNLDLTLVETYEDGSTANATAELYCVYVRRDIRQLHFDERNKYFDLFKLMKATPALEVCEAG